MEMTQEEFEAEVDNSIEFLRARWDGESASVDICPEDCCKFIVHIKKERRDLVASHHIQMEKPVDSTFFEYLQVLIRIAEEIESHVSSADEI
jgi:hypothetical protein